MTALYSLIRLPVTTENKKVVRIEPISAGKVMAAIAALFGLVGGAVFFLAGLFGAAVGGEGSEIGILISIAAIIFIPLLYGVFGFIQGAIAALIYNVTERFHGGIELRLQADHGESNQLAENE